MILMKHSPSTIAVQYLTGKFFAYCSSPLSQPAFWFNQLVVIAAFAVAVVAVAFVRLEELSPTN